MNQADTPMGAAPSFQEPDVDPALLHALLADMTDLAAVIDPDGRLSFLNPAGRRLLLLHAEVTPRTLSAWDLVVPDDRELVLDDVVATLDRTGTWSGNLNLLTSNGGTLPTRSTLRRHREPDGTPATTWVARDVSTERAVYERLHKKIFEDELTGLPHRSIFLDRLDLALRRGTTHTEAVALLFVSLDRFKEKNDRFGREVGDELLQSVAHRLSGLCSPSDTVSRWGGDEFVLMCDAVVDDDSVMAMAERIVTGFEAPFSVSAGHIFLSASVGVATTGSIHISTDELLRRAEAAGQMAKQRGGGSVNVFDAEMQARATRRAEVEDALRGATERGELVLHYQPEVSILSNTIIAVEALVRWHHPEWGLVAPAEFIPVAESSNLILELGTWVVREAMTQCATWHDQLGDRAPEVAINISPRQFSQDDFVELVARSLDATGAAPDRICLEITETVLMDDIEVTVATLRRLKALGLKLAVDDFGTGYSSLSYLRRFPVDILKVDQSFVSGLGHDPEDSAIVQAVVHMGRALGLRTVAEGVETAHHLVELRELECDVAQGYHFARPRAAESITRLLEAGPGWLSLA
jgi:diguanylate cyclase (GGDEF)-like protein